MKKLAILLTLAMLVSSVSVFAAPQINYMFYSEEDGTYYAFGSYSIKSGADMSNEDDIALRTPNSVGVYLGDNYSKKFELGENELNASKVKEEPKFGIGFKGYEEYFKDGIFSVTPYYNYACLGETKGDQKVIDSDSKTPLKSSDATLEKINIYRYALTGGNLGVMLVPEFSPEHTDYTLITGNPYAMFGEQQYIYDYKTTNSKAEVQSEIIDNGYTLKLTVTPEDTTADSKTYTFAFSNDKTDLTKNASVLTSMASAYCVYDVDDVNIKTDGGSYEYCYLYDKKLNRSNNPVITFKLKDAAQALKNANRIYFDFCIARYTTASAETTDTVFGLYDVTSGITVDANDTITYTSDAITKGDIPVATFEILSEKAVKTFVMYSVDVTNYIKSKLNSETPEDYCTLMLSIDSADYVGGALTDDAITYRIYSTAYGTTKQYYSPRLMYQ